MFGDKCANSQSRMDALLSVRHQKKHRLSKMTLDFVSLVPAGDDPMAQVVIAKAAPDDSQEEHMGPEDIAKMDDLSEDVKAYIQGLESDNEDLSKSVEDLTKERDTALENLQKAQDEVPVVKSEQEVFEETLAKADPAVRSLLQKQHDDLQAVRKQAEEERDQRLNREFISKAEAFPMISTDRATLGGLLRRISDTLTTEDAAEVEKILKAANEQIRQSNLFSEAGVTGAETTVSKSIDAQAEEIRKANPGMTIDQARAQVYAENPDLLAQAMNPQEG